MSVRPLLGVFLLLTQACVTVSRSQAAEAMKCPEAELSEAGTQNPEEGKIVVALMLLPLAVLTRTAPFSTGGRTVRSWSGCGMTYACDSDGCSETQHSRGTRLSAAVPALMERSRQRVVGATAERTGYFSWQLASPRGPTECHVTSFETWSCNPDLEAAEKASAQPEPPPAPAPVEPPRQPLRLTQP
jgi:hypothetical protein